MAKPLDEPLGVIPRDELADDPPRLGEGLEAMELQALPLERRVKHSRTALHGGSPT